MVIYPNHTVPGQTYQMQFTSSYCTFFHQQLTTALLNVVKCSENEKMNKIANEKCFNVPTFDPTVMTTTWTHKLAD